MQCSAVTLHCIQIGLFKLADCLFQIELQACLPKSDLGHLLSLWTVGHDRADRIGQGVHIMDRHHRAGFSIFNDFGYRLDVSGDNRDFS